jgi:hypothetical protein
MVVALRLPPLFRDRNALVNLGICWVVVSLIDSQKMLRVVFFYRFSYS